MNALKSILGVVGFSLVAALSIAGSPADAEAGSTTCKSVRFSFTNKHVDKRSIKVVKVKYFDTYDNQWRTEEVSNIDCAFGKTCTTKGDDLTDVEGQKITKIRFIYKYEERDGQWSKEFEGGDKEPSDPICRADRTYGPFEITG
jgi:hypothetical protein